MKILVIIAILAIAYLYINNSGKVYVNSYTKSDGTHVKAHYRNSP